MRTFLIWGLALTFILPSCVSNKKYTELMEQKESATKQLSQSQERVRTLESEKETLESNLSDVSNQKTELESQNTNLSSELNTTKTRLTDTEKKAADAEAMAKKNAEENEGIKSALNVAIAPVKNSGLSVQEADDKLYIAITKPIRYRSGSARLTSEEREALKPVADALAKEPGLMLLVEGYADAVPVRADGPWKSNRELSLARARGVVNALVRMGANRSQLFVSGHTQDRPEGAKGLPEPDVLAEHRKAELAVLVLNVGHLYKYN